jgi:hypothetical protein
MWRRPSGATAALVGAGLLVVSAVACGGGTGDDGPPPLRQNSNSYAYIIRPDDSPPHARQDVHYTVQILDSKTRQPIENGEGQLFASNAEGAKTWDGMAYGPEAGIYHAKLNFVVAGTWAVAVRFRRDSLRPLERIDWTQDVLNEKPSSVP